MLARYLRNTYGSISGALKHFYYRCAHLLFGQFRREARIPAGVDRVIFVCTGNICRSPVAERVFSTCSSIPTCSIGLDTDTGLPALGAMVELARSCGIDLQSHTATSIADFSTRPRDLYACMEPRHAEMLRERLGSSLDSVVLLGMFARRPRVYIHDPMNASDEYRLVSIALIREACESLALSVARSGAHP